MEMEMEMEPTKPQVIGKKLWKIVRIVFFMIKSGISKKSKLMVDLNLLLKRGNKLAEKAIASLIFHHHHHHHHHSSSSSSLFGCRSNDGFISPKEYEFSCSNSPAFPFYPHKRNKHHHHQHHHHHLLNSNKAAAKSYYYDDVATIQRVILEMLNNDNHQHHQQQHAAVEAPSPLITLPGFGRSPLVRQLRITDSPFPLKDDDGDCQVDKAAEEFIMKFYKDLKLQQSMAALDSPFRF